MSSKQRVLFEVGDLPCSLCACRVLAEGELVRGDGWARTWDQRKLFKVAEVHGLEER